MFQVETPSRICLFGEHQDYLGLEVIVSAVGLYFRAQVEPRPDRKVVILIRDRSLGELGQENTGGLYEDYHIDLDEPLEYDGARDYFRSSINVLRRAGIEPVGVNIRMDSEIPIGKGMCSSTAMVLTYLTALAAASCPERAGDARLMARLAWEAEVTEFEEPGGMMDHYAAALGGLCHMDFESGKAEAFPLSAGLNGRFILIDSLEPKDTIRVLSDSKYPTLEGLRELERYGIHSIRDFFTDPEARKYLGRLAQYRRQRLEANIQNYALQREALDMLERGSVDDEKLGRLLSLHQAALRDGLGISTERIDGLLELAEKHGAYGGKLNGSGGGGCLFVYAPQERGEEIISAVNRAGYPAAMLCQSEGLRITLEG